MSQILACKTANGIILAADSKSIEMDFVRLLIEPLAKTFGFDIYGPSMSGGMIDMHVFLNDRRKSSTIKFYPAGNVSQKGIGRQLMQLTDMAPLERWIELEMDIHQKSGLDVNVFNTKGYRISELKNWANQLCPAIKATDKGQSFICAPAHMNIATLAMRSKQAVIEECDAGMLKLVVPIFVGDEFVGAVGACGFLLDDGEVDGFLVNKMTDISESRIEYLAIGIKSISTAKAQALGHYIENQINAIVRPTRHPR